jgi:hypothetical protein
MGGYRHVGKQRISLLIVLDFRSQQVHFDAIAPMWAAVKTA